MKNWLHVFTLGTHFHAFSCIFTRICYCKKCTRLTLNRSTVYMYSSWTFSTSMNLSHVLRWQRAHMDYGRDSWQQTPLAGTKGMPCHLCKDPFHYQDRSMNSFPALVLCWISVVKTHTKIQIQVSVLCTQLIIDLLKCAVVHVYVHTNHFWMSATLLNGFYTLLIITWFSVINCT